MLEMPTRSSAACGIFPTARIVFGAAIANSADVNSRTAPTTSRNGTRHRAALDERERVGRVHVGQTEADARTGRIVWSLLPGGDVGRGLAADIDPRHRGHEIWTNTPVGTYTGSRPPRRFSAARVVPSTNCRALAVLGGLFGAGIASASQDMQSYDKMLTYTEGFKQLGIYSLIIGVVVVLVSPLIRRLMGAVK